MPSGRIVGQPGFTAVAVLTLALGIGANTAIFSVVNAVLLKSLPFKDPEQLVMVWNRGAAAAGGDRTPLAVADLLDWRAQNRSFADIAAFQGESFNYAGGDLPEQLQAANVTANFFSVLGVQAQLGRTFLPEEDRPGAQHIALLSDGFWRRRFGGDTQVWDARLLWEVKLTRSSGSCLQGWTFLPKKSHCGRHCC
jgi:putative ABC transport system permease protein